MVMFYARLVRAGKLDIEDVPAKWRELVAAGFSAEQIKDIQKEVNKSVREKTGTTSVRRS